MRDEAEEVLLRFEDKEKATYEGILKQLDEYFVPHGNVIYEQFQFNSRVQQPGESVGSYITSLHTLAEQCKYGKLKDELIRDNIVVGIANGKVSERLQLQKI